ncbi:NAD(P)-dependent oxidoreductase [Acidimangrovimonas sediminis]|uniref:NAD(P)-dependent oxidoreductase n=1 Tax=Acidimangrovimonas sediminis TaxID=2056283 RepID=UPI000C807F92|nr:NAD(P)-dependent oxidoreductase [Acidimangrovimonas sediminis]
MVRVLIHQPIHAAGEALLRDAGLEIVREGPMAEADAVIVRTGRVGAEAFGGRLGHVSKHGVGVDNVDLEAARAAGVLVTNTPGANAVAVAEHALMLMLMLAKSAPAMERAARAGCGGIGVAPVVDLAGRRLLIVGYGASGRRLGVMAQALGMRVSVVSRSLRGEATGEGFAVAPDLMAALPETDVLSLHCPLTEETRGMIGAGELAALPAGAFLVNVARGGIVDEAALLTGAGHLGGVGLDVTEVEPLPVESPLMDLPNLILTPHSAGISEGAMRQMAVQSAQNVIDALSGKLDPACVIVLR